MFNLIAVIFSLLAAIMFFKAAFTYGGKLRISLIFTSIGIFIGVSCHSLAEYFELGSLIKTDLLLYLMPILIFVGSVFMIIGGYLAVRAIKS